MWLLQLQSSGLAAVDFFTEIDLQYEVEEEGLRLRELSFQKCISS